MNGYGFLDNPLTHIGLGILGANQPGSSAGQAIGRGGLLGLQSLESMRRNQALQEAQQQRQEALAFQMAQAKAKAEREKEERERWEALAAQMNMAGMPTDAIKARYQAQLAAQIPGQSPAAVREYQYFQQLSPAQREEYLRVKRAQQWLNTGQYHVPAPMNPIGTLGAMPPPTTVQGIPGAPGQRQMFVDENGQVLPVPQGEVIDLGQSGQMPAMPPQPMAVPGGAIPITPKASEMPGFKADVEAAKKQAQMETEAATKRQLSQGSKRRAAEAQQMQNQFMQELVDQAKSQASGWTTGFFGSAMSNIPGTPAFDLSQTLNTVRANVGFDKLQDLRDSSPTGGALGQVTERELAFLQSVWGSLEQSQGRAQFVKNLDRVMSQTRQSWKRVAKAYEEEYGEPLITINIGDRKPSAAPAGGGGGKVIDFADLP